MKKQLMRAHAPKCSSCGALMQSDILHTHFPKGALPTRGYRCPQCRYELIPLDEAKRVQHEAQKLGLFGIVNPLVRKITKSGNNLAVYIPKDFEKTLGLKKGMQINMWIKEDEICIQVA